MDNRSFVLCIKESFQPLTTNVIIPAYDKNKNGIVFNLVMDVNPNDSLTVEANGSVATSLKKNLGRAITILSNIDSSWRILRKFKYNLISMENQFRVMDTRSAGLPICIALLNIARNLNGMEQVQHITGTGILRIDGTFEKSHLEEEKKQATSQLMESRFISSQVCKHVFDLANLMNS
ncbi:MULTISPECIES: hypothetical protein [unclassified Legionella]|uniref:hypothetical protein n=1 Tax=unclassified Legionella TaxID=2622702 RepID=UPI001056D6C4|nr:MULTISPECIES: hypothetical protein [unclassified Legionella]MDI9818516.1 hypothetical protein [Legionella sp. PL877]